LEVNTEIILIVLSLIVSAFFSSSETALTSLSKIKVAQIVKSGSKNAKYFNLWMKHPNKMLNTILIGNNVANIFASVLAGSLANKLSGSSQIAITTAVMTILILFFGEITPKTFAKHNAEAISAFFIRPLVLLYYLFYPFTYVINVFVKVVIKIMGGKIDKEQPLITEDEIEFMINVGEEEGILEDETKEMMHNIMDIKDISVKEIMVPRTEMVAVSIDSTIDDVLKVIEEYEFSRIPVYENDLDHIAGILYVKDLIMYAKEGLKNLNIDLKNMIKEPFFVPETKNIYDLFKEFQSKRVHLAIVIDEYGGVAGIATMEDILEEIVGEIRDEYDSAEEDEFVEVNENTFLVDAGMDLDDFCEKLGIEKTEDMEDYETVGGLIYDLADKIPSEGEELDFGDKFRIKVLKTEGNKIVKVEVKRIENE